MVMLPTDASKRRRRERPALDMNNLPKAVSPEQAAEVLGLTIDSYYRHVHPSVARGEILSYRIGRQRRVITASLLAWNEQRGAGAAA